jgi:hypothetical protein
MMYASGQVLLSKSDKRLLSCKRSEPLGLYTTVTHALTGRIDCDGRGKNTEFEPIPRVPGRP